MLIESIPNVSEGRRPDVVAGMAAAIRAVEGVRLLDHSSDASHNRSVFTLVGDAAGVERAVLAGSSMGAHTAVRVALEHPERVLALGLITPAYEPDSSRSVESIASYDRLARGLREGGVEGFVAAYPLERLPEAWRATVTTVLRQRLGAHEHPLAVADALEAVPRSQPFASMDELSQIAVPTLVVASRDEADPEHPLAVGERYARAIAGAELLVEDEGPPTRSPLAWQGGQLSKALAALAARVVP
jgi:pimeloyl-ACP methyl ester carboxylesterase